MSKIIIFIFLVSICLTGCKGTETREKVDDTVEEFAGKKKVDRMEQMKKDLGRIKDQQNDRFEQLEGES